MENKKGKFNFKNFWFPLFIFAVAVICFYKIVDMLPDIFKGFLDFTAILTPFIVGIVIAFLLYRPVKKLEGLIGKSNKKFFKSHARGFSVLICYVVLIIAIATVLYLILPRIFASIVNLVNGLPEYYASAIKYIEELAGSDKKIMGFDVTEITKKINIGSLFSFLNFETITKYAQSVFKATGAIVDFSMSLVVSVYVLLSSDHLIRVVYKLLTLLFPKKKLADFYDFLTRTCEIFYNYVYSQLLDALVVTALCFVTFSIIRVPYALLFAVIMGLSNLIPYFGALIGGFSVVLVNLITTGSILKSIIVLICVIASQQLDANVIQPKIVADSVGLRPIYVLLAITVGGGLFGFVGILIGVPVLAVIRMIVLNYIQRLGNDDTMIVKKQTELSASQKEEKEKKEEKDSGV